jgi:hypothetical protein
MVTIEQQLRVRLKEGPEYVPFGLIAKAATWLEILDKHCDYETEDYDPNAKFVAVYYSCQHYGGPEEGGWYYNNNHLTELHDVTDWPQHLIDELTDRLGLKYDFKTRKNHRNDYSNYHWCVQSIENLQLYSPKPRYE